MFMITTINLALILVNLYSVGCAEKKLEAIEDKLDDLAVIEERLKHLCENMDSAFL